jgi:hypothetical protein
VSPTDLIRRSISHWETPREIHPGEWEDATPAIPVCDVRVAGRNELPAGIRDAPHLLRSGLLLGSLQRRRPAPRRSCNSILNNPV